MSAAAGQRADDEGAITAESDVICVGVSSCPGRVEINAKTILHWPPSFQA